MSGQTKRFWVVSGQTVLYYGLDTVACLDRQDSTGLCLERQFCILWFR